jgi:hypothetical protein
MAKVMKTHTLLADKGGAVWVEAGKLQVIGVGF